MREKKDSGVEWIGVIPNHWHIKKVKYLFEIVKRIAGSEGFDILSVTQKGLKIKDISSGEGQIAENYSNYQFVYPNDFVMNHMDLITGWIDVSQLFGVTSPDYRVFRLMDRESHNIGFFKYVMQNCYLNRIFYSRGQGVSSMGRWRLQTFVFNNFDIPIPPLKEQQSISDFLDNKCAEIDALMEDIRAEISTLEEYKKSVITEAVTKGLNPDAEMKDSGIAWVGEIPGHWEIVNPKSLFTLRKDKAFSGQRQLTASQQYGVIYQDEYMNLTGNKVVIVEKDFDILKQVKAGDFVISMRSFQGGLEYSPYDGSISSAYNMLIPNTARVHNSYYKWLLKSPGYISALQSTSNLIRDGQAMRYSNFAKVPLPSLPLKEQQTIADYLDPKCAEIEATIAEKQKQLTILEEYKKSLIYEYVTGKKEVPTL